MEMEEQCFHIDRVVVYPKTAVGFCPEVMKSTGVFLQLGYVDVELLAVKYTVEMQIMELLKKCGLLA